MTGSATLSINPESYGALLSKYLPMPITSEHDNEQALEVVQNLMVIERRSPEKESLPELLVQLIERLDTKKRLPPWEPLFCAYRLHSDHR